MSNDKTNEILEIIRQNPGASSGKIHALLGTKMSYATVKRKIATLISENKIHSTGQGKATQYFLVPGSELFSNVDLNAYFETEMDKRKIQTGFNFSLIPKILDKAELFTSVEQKHLETLQQKYLDNVSKLSETERKNELERLAIDLSWKSSQIEGNTYSLLETERLLKEKETTIGKTREEASMLINHKIALDFLIENPIYMEPISVAKIENLHSILVQDLNIDRNIRRRLVRITGTNYAPLDNEFQIREALELMCVLINARKNHFEKALLTLLLLSYIQPFSDGNKRTARITCNAILMSGQFCPLSFRTVDSLDYKKAMLLFYEQNNMSHFKKIFLEQVEFAVGAYF